MKYRLTDVQSKRPWQRFTQLPCYSEIKESLRMYRFYFS